MELGEMEIDMIEIINGLLCSDPDKIRASTAALMEAYKNPNSLLGLVDIVKTNTEAQIRHSAVVLLSKRLCNLRHWSAVPAEHKATIMSDIPQALYTEEEMCVTTVLAQFVAILIKNEVDKSERWIVELIVYILHSCSSSEPRESERASSIYATLMAAAADQFGVHHESFYALFVSLLLTAETQVDLTTPTMVNVMKGTSYVLPFIVGDTATEEEIVTVLPLVLIALDEFALKGDSEKFHEVSMMLYSITKNVAHPEFLVTMVLQFCLHAASNREMNDNIRVCVIAFLARFVPIHKKAIVQLNLLQTILCYLFEIMCTDDDDGHSVGASSVCLQCTWTLELLSTNMPEEIVEPMVQLLEPAFRSTAPMCRGIGYLCLGILAVGCSKLLRHKYLRDMVDAIIKGIADSEPQVQAPAFFALSRFSSLFQPEISELAPLIVPGIFENLIRLVQLLWADQPEPSWIVWLFRSMNTFWEHLEMDIAPHLPILMDCLFDILDPSNSLRIRGFALGSVKRVVEAAKEHVVPYIERIIEILCSFLLRHVPDEMAPLRLQAIETLASIIRILPKEPVMPLLNPTKIYCLMMLEEGPISDPDLRASIYGLIGALSSLMNESMAEVLPQVIPPLIQTLVCTEELDLIQEADSEESADDVPVKNDYPAEKMSAIRTLSELAVNTRAAFGPYICEALENIYNMLDHASHQIRTSSAVAICDFLTALNKSGLSDDVTLACETLIPKFADMMYGEEVARVLIRLLDEMGTFFRINKQAAMPNQECAELIHGCIRDVFLHKMTCQLNDHKDDDEDDEDMDRRQSDKILRSAAKLLASLGYTLDSMTFSLYFGRLYHFLTRKLAKDKKNDNVRAYIYGTLAESFQNLESCTALYFHIFCPLLLDGTKDSDAKSRENSFYALGVLVSHSEETSFDSYQTILDALYDASIRETSNAAKDNIGGALACMLRTNVEAMPLAVYLPVFLSFLPLQKDFEVYDTVLKTFHKLYTEADASTIDHLEEMLYIIILALQDKQIAYEDTKETAMKFIKLVRTEHPEKFNNILNANPEVLEFVGTL